MAEDTTPYQDRINELIDKYPVLDSLLAELGEEIIYNIAIDHIAVSSLKARLKAKKH